MSNHSLSPRFPQTENRTLLQLTIKCQGEPKFLLWSARRYQTLVHVRNDESAPGGRPHYRPEDGFFQWSPFVQVPGNSSVEVGVVSAEPPEEVRLETYLSLNRRIMRLRVEPLDVETIVRKPPFNGSRESA